jgi:hypothetical protein
MRNWPKNGGGLKMKHVVLAAYIVLGLRAASVTPAHAQHDHMKGMDMPAKQTDTASANSALKPAQGARVQIVSPKAGQVIKGDSVPLEFKLTKGKIGEHVHAYVDGEMVGMFQSGKGTLNGIKPGQHTLELRVTTGDHNTELNATDKVSFMTK